MPDYLSDAPAQRHPVPDLETPIRQISGGCTILLMFHNRVRSRTDQRLSTIVVTNCEDRRLVRPLTDFDDLRGVFCMSDRASMDVQSVSDVCVHRYLLQPCQCLAAMAGATVPHGPRGTRYLESDATRRIGAAGCLSTPARLAPSPPAVRQEVP